MAEQGQRCPRSRALLSGSMSSRGSCSSILIFAKWSVRFEKRRLRSFKRLKIPDPPEDA